MPTLDFKGKQHIYAHHLTVPYSPLVVDPQKSHPAAQQGDAHLVPDGNLIIQGDNLRALKALLPRYAGKVNCIYIDPPYNTGNEGWIYNDNVNSPMMKQWLENNSPVDNEDLERHDKWLCMMWPRMQLFHQLLAQDGVIFVSIDDNEQAHLRALMDEIFGEENFLASLIWQHRTGRSNNARRFSNQREMIHIYRRSPKVDYIRVARSAALDDTYSNPDNDPNGPWTSASYVNPATKEKRPNLVYEISNPHTARKVSHPTHAWKYSYETHLEHVRDERLYWGADGKMRYPRLKNYLRDATGIVPIDLTLSSESSTTDAGTRLLNTIFDSTDVFPNPKPVDLIAHCIRVSDGVERSLQEGSSIVLDSFAGSGTTAHATLALNKEDGGSRRFIVIECEEYADTITAERVRRVIDGVADAKDEQLRAGLGGSFTYCTLGNPFDAESLLSGEGLPDYETLAVFLLHTAAGLSLEPDALRTARNDQRFYRAETTDFYLYYEPDIEWLKTDDAMLTPERAKQIKAVGKPATVFGAGKYLSQRELTDMGIVFCQLPYELFKGG